MKTVQHYLKKLKTKKLVEAYFERYPIDYNVKEIENLSVKMIKYLNYMQIRKFIKKLRKLKIKQPKQESILYAYRCIDDDSMPRLEVSLVYRDDILQNGIEATSYAYEFHKQSEIMGFLIADTELTQSYIYDVLADVLYEASFFGFKQKCAVKEKKKLDKIVENFESGKEKGIPFDIDKFDLGLLYTETPKGRELNLDIVNAKSAYTKYYCEKELAELMANLGI